MNVLEKFHNKSLGLLILRVTLAVVFIYHGWGKVSDIDAYTGFFTSIGFGGIWLYLVAYGEFLGGIALLLGVCVREVSALLSIIMIGAIWLVHLPNGFAISNGGYEFALTLLGGSLALVFLGSGRYSVWRKDSCDMHGNGTCTCDAKPASNDGAMNSPRV